MNLERWWVRYRDGVGNVRTVVVNALGMGHAFGIVTDAFNVEVLDVARETTTSGTAMFA